MAEPSSPRNLIVFSDLDGTLLDHQTYDWRPAEPAISRLREQSIPLVLASSKTAAEIMPLREAMGIAHCPAIVENGAGILAPGGAAPGERDQYQRLLEALADLPGELSACFRGFAQMDTSEVSNLTGLDDHEAALARKRCFSEPGLWSGSAEQFSDFRARLRVAGISATQGGRFLTLSHGADKADCAGRIITEHSAGGGHVFSVGLGDAPNDIAMLQAVSLGIIIPNPAHGGIGHLRGEESGTIRRAANPGPAGWNEAVLGVLNEMDQPVRRKEGNG